MAGNPAALRYPACWQSLPRTPWDLALGDGRLLVGLGNDANGGPTANDGPVPLFALQLDSGRWQRLATLPEEQIRRFVRHDRQLWIPGADGRGSWRWGNLYRHGDGAALWVQERRLPRSVHVHDLVLWRGRLLVAGSVPDAVSSGPPSERHGSALAASADGGHSWRVQRLPAWRATSLLPLSNHLYALEAQPGPQLRRSLVAGERWTRFADVWQWMSEGRWQARPSITAQLLLPGVAGAGARFAWIDGVTPSPQGAAWIASLGSRREEPSRRRRFCGTGNGRRRPARAGRATVCRQPGDGSAAPDSGLAAAQRPAPGIRRLAQQRHLGDHGGRPSAPAARAEL